MSDEEIISFINKSKGNVCGNFRKGQLNRELVSSDNTPRRTFISFAAMLAALSVGIPSVQGNSKAAQEQTTPEKSGAAMMPYHQSDTSYRITGIVTDETGESIWYAIVRLDTTVLGTTTDSTGRFVLEIPSDYKEKTIRLVVSFIGFYTQEITLPLTGNANATDEPMLSITLYPNEKGGIEIKRLTFWERLRYKVKQRFH